MLNLKNTMVSTHCKKCNRWQDSDQFYNNSARPSGKDIWCIDCRKAAVAASRQKKANRADWFSVVEKRKEQIGRYGMTLDHYEILFKAQDGLCAICRMDNGNKPLSVDHDHITGNIRGLLCKNCNVGIGMLKDRPDVIDAASRYLKHYKGISTPQHVVEEEILPQPIDIQPHVGVQ